MNIASKMKHSCAACWHGRRKCNAAVNDRCQRCVNYLLKRGIVNAACIEYAAPLYNTGLSEQLFKNPPLGSLPSFDTMGLDSMTLDLRITPSNGPTVEVSLDLSGPFTTQNKDTISSMDGLARRFSAEVKAKKGASTLIPTSALTGGYLHLLCSIVDVTEQAATNRDGTQVDNNFNGYNIEKHFKYLMICRLQQLMSGTLEANRVDDQENEPTDRSINAYGAAVVLRRELSYFKGHINGGSLHYAAHAGIKPLLIEWFVSIERELLGRICEGCGRFPAWRSSTIEGSMKKLRRHGETLTMGMHLHLKQSTVQLPYLPSSSSLFTSIGNGQDMIAMPDIIASPTSFEDLMLSNPDFGEMDMLDPLSYSEATPQATLGYGDDMEFVLDGSEFTGAQGNISMSDLLKEATFDPGYMTATGWYPDNYTFDEALN